MCDAPRLVWGSRRVEKRRANVDENKARDPPGIVWLQQRAAAGWCVQNGQDWVREWCGYVVSGARCS